MKNGLIIFVFACALGLSLSVGFNSVLGQEKEKTEFDKYATTTIENLDTKHLMNENYKNTKEITDRLDLIIRLLRQK